MSLDPTRTGTTSASQVPTVTVLVDDELAARRIESLLQDDGLIVDVRGRAKEPPDSAGAVLVAAFGRGITQRDQQLRRLCRSLPDTRLVAVIPEDSRRGVRRALEAGADGVVFDNRIEVSLAPSVRAVLAGQTTVPAAGRHEVDRPTLSGREKQVLGMVVMGMSNKAIAGQLFLAESTVKCHLSSDRKSVV